MLTARPGKVVWLVYFKCTAVNLLPNRSSVGPMCTDVIISECLTSLSHQQVQCWLRTHTNISSITNVAIVRFSWWRHSRWLTRFRGFRFKRSTWLGRNGLLTFCSRSAAYLRLSMNVSSMASSVHFSGRQPDIRCSLKQMGSSRNERIRDTLFSLMETIFIPHSVA